MAINPLAQSAVEAYLGAVDAELPGRISGLYLVGSVALDDFRPGRSDLDFVAVTDTSLSTPEVVALQHVHQRLARRRRRPDLDGSYVTWHDLARDPLSAPAVATTRGGRLGLAPSCNPVTWQTLADSGIAVRGPHRGMVPVWTNRHVLSDWIRDNLDNYWRPWLDRHGRLLSGPGLTGLWPSTAAWGVLGVSRLHYTLATGRITSKTGAGEHAWNLFDTGWYRIVDECLRIRRGHGRRRYLNPLARRRHALSFVAMVIDDCYRRPFA